MMWFLNELPTALPSDLKSVPHRSKECIHMKALKKKRRDPISIRCNPRQKKNPVRTFTPEEISNLKARALKLWKADDGRAKELGDALLAVKAAVPHGEFKPWWLKNKLSQHRVSYCLRVASGKVAASKRKARTSEQNLISEIKQEVDACLKYCANIQKAQSLDQVEA